MAADIESYAEKTKKGHKGPSILLRVALKGDVPLTISRDLWHTFDQVLLDLIMDEEEKSDRPPVVLFEWVSYSKGMGLICPVSMEARTRLQELVSRVRINDFEFRAWAAEETRPDFIVIRLPPPVTETDLLRVSSHLSCGQIQSLPTTSRWTPARSET